MQNENNSNRKRILISGASVAGPALAYWLNHFGFQVTLVEQTSTLRTGGYKVDIRGAAIKVAEQMGIIADIRQASTRMEKATFVNRANKPIVTFPADFIAGRSDGDDEIMRGDLAFILYEHTKNNTEYIFNDTISSLREEKDGVQVAFKNSEARTFDLVVGADGLHSNVRALAFGEESQFTQYLGAYISIFTAPNLLELDHAEIYYGSAGKAVSVYSVKKSEAKNLFIFKSPLLNYNRHDSQQQKQILVDAFAGNEWKIPQLLQSVWDTPDFYFDAVSLVKMERWSTGRIVLLGDAAYCASPASGQGTGLALVGAYLLAGELATTPDDYQTAFVHYEDAMREYVRVNQNFAVESIKRMIPQTQTQVFFQAQMMRLLPFMPGKNLISKKIQQSVHQLANGITLPHYSAQRQDVEQKVAER